MTWRALKIQKFIYAKDHGGGEKNPYEFEKYIPNRLRDTSDIFDELQWALK